MPNTCAIDWETRTRRCTRCDVIKDYGDFTKNLSKKHPNGEYYISSICKKCLTKDAQKRYHNLSKKEQVELNKKRNKARRETRRIKLRESRYGISPKDYERMYTKQDGKCFICEIDKDLVIDHCHDTGVVRGLLCRKCNSGLGLLQDSTIVLQKSIQYLERGDYGPTTVGDVKQFRYTGS